MNVEFPKFKVETTYEFSNILKHFNVKTLFTDQADFSGLSVTDVYVSKIIQKCFVEVDEEGTEAAAATAVVMRTKAMMKP